MADESVSEADLHEALEVGADLCGIGWRTPHGDAVDTVDPIAKALAAARQSGAKGEWVSTAKRQPEGKARKLLVVYCDGSHGSLNWSSAPAAALPCTATHWAEYPSLPDPNAPETK